ncbi:hypothetical protein L195_g042704 [Trifolium pratense]|uniref:Reverse transcriptase zinc-binding domain-containing protein n=1 Tax=Trifolium pratense TaxID=57577 RepID=A0A2K3M762_TRIPR|nr:hypothetical protein L195_g042704 [Trifolium pratense]
MGLGSPNCKWCRDVEETTLHVLRDCPYALNLWMKTDDNKQVDWAAFCAYACHVLWLWSNTEIHEENWSLPIHPWFNVYSNVTNYNVAKSVGEIDTFVSKTEVLVNWYYLLRMVGLEWIDGFSMFVAVPVLRSYGGCWKV